VKITLSVVSTGRLKSLLERHKVGLRRLKNESVLKTDGFQEIRESAQADFVLFQARFQPPAEFQYRRITQSPFPDFGLKNAGEVAHMRGRSVEKRHFDSIKAAGLFLVRFVLKVVERGAADLTAFKSRDGFGGDAVIAAPASLHLHEYERVPLSHDAVHFAVPAAVVPRYDLISPFGQPLFREGFSSRA
jgi:hypothetical protein